MLVNLVMRTGGGGPRFVAEPAPIEPVRRKKVENAEPGMLMEHFHKDGWTVQDVRLGNLYDATATKNGRTLAGVQRYGDGRCCGHRYQNEVEWAHPGDCVIGTFSDVTFPPDRRGRHVERNLQAVHFGPVHGALAPRACDFTPATGGRLDLAGTPRLGVLAYGHDSREQSVIDARSLLTEYS
ncbi:hypothetical protein [Micromonospora zamorensis]|uniref:hypothetical protein n=1 Tax=Micromonospora zamorensis TaxID=709883 RepID=UPI003799078F